MSFLFCGSDGAQDKENVNPFPKSSKAITPQCFGVKMASDVSREPLNVESLTLVVKRGKSGYGFSVTGSSPARVKRVEEGSTSHLAGLRENDAIIRINGQNVSRAIADSVAKIVRNSEKQIVLDIEREQPPEKIPSSSVKQTSTTVNNNNNNINKHTIHRHPLTTIRESINESSTMAPEEFQVTCSVDIETVPRTPSMESLTSLQMCQENLLDLGDWEASSPKLVFPPMRIGFQDLSDQEQERQASIRKLVQCEKEFVSQMQFGIQKYSTPLRHNMISPAEHCTLFQNVEKLVAISEYHVYKLDEESVGYSDVHDKNEKFVDIIGSVYLPKVFMMTEVFEQYCNGIKNAFRLLAELKRFEEFELFLNESTLEPSQPTIASFLQRPLEHIKTLVLSLQKVLTLTPLDHQDMENLSQVVEALRVTCNRINENNTRRSRSMTSLVSRSSSRSSLKSSRSKRARSSSSSGSVAPSVLSCDSSASNIEASVDPEVLEIQRRLVFCEHVQTFQLATATRHMIYAGELMHVDGLLCTKLYVVLMSDLILLTKLEPDERLLVVDYPLLLQDVINTDFRDSDTLDFSVTSETGIDEEWVEEHDVTFRAPSMEQKYTWKSILEQRTQCCKLQQDFMTLDNFV